MDDPNYTILLVEDEENDALLLKRAFKRNNIVGLRAAGAVGVIVH